MIQLGGLDAGTCAIVRFWSCWITGGGKSGCKKRLCLVWTLSYVWKGSQTQPSHHLWSLSPMTFFKRKPSHPIYPRRVRPELEVLEDQLLLSVLYDESVSGDLSNNQAAPTALVLGLGTNSIKGTVNGSTDSQDWITLHLPTGLSLNSLVLASYVSTDSQGFIGVQSGTSFVGSASSASSYLGYTHYGTGATNGTLPPTNLVGTNILPLMGDTSLAAGAQGFTPPLSSGDYTFVIQQLGSSTAYQFDFDTVSNVSLQSITVTPANPSVAKGLTDQFTATGTFSDNSTQDVTNQVTWASATPSVATITAAGLASAAGTGTSTISATLNGIAGSTTLTVTAATLQSIAVTPANPSVAIGLTEQFIATGTFTDNSTQDVTNQVTWVSATPSVATITAAGLTTGVAAGTSTISATLNGISGSTVEQVVSANNPLPSLTSISPNNVPAGSADTTITLTGTDFLANSTADFGATPLATIFVNGTTLTAVIPAADLTTGGTSAITVVNPGPGGGVSAPQTFTIDNPAPTLTSISPNSAPAGSPDTTITLIGTDFVSTSTADLGATPLTTTFVNGTTLTAVIPAADLAVVGPASVTVVTPGPGGGTSG